MNYRHAFHAGNFADLAKHAAVGLILDRLLADPAPLSVIDTHAGAGLYDLTASMALKSGEAEAGVFRLMADPQAPAAFDTLTASVRRLNPQGGVRLYPGSPRLIAERLRPVDSYVGAELQEEDFRHLQATLSPFARRAQAVPTDGYDLARQAGQRNGRLFVLVDPPFERGDDYQQAADLAKEVLRRKRNAVVAIWTPLKDLETFDAFVRRLEQGVDGPLLAAEVRLRALDNPMQLNGCALVFLNPPKGLGPALKPALDWIVGRGVDLGGGVRLWTAGA